MKQENYLTEMQEIIKEFAFMHMGVADKFLLNKIIQGAREIGISEYDDFQYVYRAFLDFFPEKTKTMSGLLSRLEAEERNKCEGYVRYFEGLKSKWREVENEKPKKK